MRKYKPGDEVRILKTRSWDGSDLSGQYAVGDICIVRTKTDEDGDTWVFTKNESDYFFFPQDAIEPAEKTWDTLDHGDVLASASGYYLVTQGVIGDAVLVTERTGTPHEAALCYSKLELQRCGYTIKQPEQTDEVIELTLDDVAKLKGVSVEKIRIKE